jgi:5-methylcytosine-specific restriction enzyme subunit McrC
MRKPIQRYEYETIAIGEEGFTEAHFNALRIWNERNGGNYFEERHRKLKCKQFVGVVQVGQVVIEILPKADRNTDDKQRWRKALLTMLRKVHGLRLHTPDDADQALRHTHLMDLFLEAYVQEVRALVHLGLVKKYHARSGNQPALKGRLDFPRHLRLNLVHKERFAVVHQTYDTDHLLHSILNEALDIVQSTCTNAGITGSQDGTLRHGIAIRTAHYPPEQPGHACRPRAGAEHLVRHGETVGEVHPSVAGGALRGGLDH